MVFTPKPQFRGRKLVFQNLFSPLSNHKLPVQLPPLHHPSSPTTGDMRMLRKAVSSKSILKEKSWHFHSRNDPS